jgi:hypothetical protein
MACERYNDALSEVAAGGQSAEGFDAHLPECASCGAELVLLRRTMVIADDELQQLVAAEPRDGFVPRVRAAVVESRSRRISRVNWMWPSLATAAALLVVLVLGVTRYFPKEEPAVAARVLEPARKPASISTAAVTTAPAAAPAVPAPRARKVGRSLPAQAEVLVPAGESDALFEFIAIVNSNRVIPAALGAAGRPSPPLAVLPPIEIEQIEIVPLDPPTSLGT